MSKQLEKLTILFVVFVYIGFLASSVLAGPLTVVNPSFESGATGWSNISVDNSEFYAPVDGTYYATSSGGSSYTSQLTGHTIEAGQTYTLTVWARSLNAEGNDAATTAEARCYYGSTTINAVTANVNPPVLQGKAGRTANDDGGNVWLDGGYRMEFADSVMCQADTADPIADDWLQQRDADYIAEMAAGPIITPEGLKGIYWTYYEEAENISEIWFATASGSPPDYTWTTPVGTVLTNTADADPWVIDAHLYYDADTSKLWMSWGGGTCWVSEMDPCDAQLIDHPASTEFDTHPAGTHTEVAYWNGDEWTAGNTWMEGPCLYKHNGYWYFLASYGDLAVNYTIRGGRGSSPTGPFYDKDGVNLMTYDSGEAEYGNSFLLGADGEQANPGHPHIWEEGGQHYLGYDWTIATNKDRLGIRKLYFVNDWPTIWVPIEVTFNSNDYPSSIGQTLGISVRNVGDASSTGGIDYVALEYTGGTPDNDPPTPDPMTWASVPAADSDTAISMTATTASDPSGVEYYFDETTANPGGNDSGWQDSTSYTDDGLTASTQYCYEVTARDKSVNQNATAASSNECATTLAGCTATDMHIESVVCAEVSCGGANKNGQATVTIYDDCGDPVQNALVDGTFSGAFNETFYDVATDGNGVAVFTTAGCIKKPTFSFTVDDVTDTLPYDPGDDLATGCSG
jgi:hypothetical protein